MTVAVTILTGGVWREALTDPPVQASVRSPRTRIPQSEAGGHRLLSRTSSAGASRLQQLSGTAGDPPQPPTHGKAVTTDIARREKLANCNCYPDPLRIKMLVVKDAKEFEAHMNLSCPAHGFRRLGKLMVVQTPGADGTISEECAKRKELVTEYDRRLSEFLKSHPELKDDPRRILICVVRVKPKLATHAGPPRPLAVCAFFTPIPTKPRSWAGSGAGARAAFRRNSSIHCPNWTKSSQCKTLWRS